MIHRLFFTPKKSLILRLEPHLFEFLCKNNISILAFSTNFCHITTDLSGNTIWPQASSCQKLDKTDDFLAFLMNFCSLKM